MFFDPMYLLFLAPGMLLAMWAQFKVQSAYHQASRVPARSGFSGAEAAHAVLRSAGVDTVRIEPTEGFLSDHYVPGERVLRLSPDVYAGRSLAALGIAAHEAGHALQEAQRYPLMGIRNAIVPLASIGSSMAWIVILVGFFMHAFGLILAGIALFSLTVVFQLVNLPVEFDASRRAKLALQQIGLVGPDEAPVVANVLGAAAMTYVAATLTSILTLLYFLYRSGILGNSRD